MTMIFMGYTYECAQTTETRAAVERIIDLICIMMARYFYVIEICEPMFNSDVKEARHTSDPH